VAQLFARPPPSAHACARRHPTALDVLFSFQLFRHPHPPPLLPCTHPTPSCHCLRVRTRMDPLPRPGTAVPHHPSHLPLMHAQFRHRSCLTPAPPPLQSSLAHLYTRPFPLPLQDRTPAYVLFFSTCSLGKLSSGQDRTVGTSVPPATVT
jgi:hypothetical protein